MLIFIRGTDKGNAVFKSLVLVIILSSLFISLLGRINAIEQYANKYKAQVLSAIEESNRELIRNNEFH